MYFSLFPKRTYDMTGNGNEKLVTDILRRIKIKESIKNNFSLFDKYDVSNGETPEEVAFKIYGSPEYHWVVLILNDVTDRYYGWPLSDYAFEEYVKNKYANPGAIHHYEVTQSSGRTSSNGPEDYSFKIEVNSDATGAEAVTNYEYERRLQEQKRQIRILAPSYLPAFEQEFKRLVKR